MIITVYIQEILFHSHLLCRLKKGVVQVWLQSVYIVIATFNKVSTIEHIIYAPFFILPDSRLADFIGNSPTFPLAALLYNSMTIDNITISPSYKLNLCRYTTTILSILCHNQQFQGKFVSLHSF